MSKPYAFTQYAPVTKSDDPEDNFAEPTRAIWVGGAGDLAVIPRAGANPIVLTNVPAGTLLPIAVIRVHSTGTDASDVVALN